jgi:hypothetical protein
MKSLATSIKRTDMAEPYRKNPETEPPSLPDILGKLDDEATTLGGDLPARVPLVIYIGDERKIVGDAVVRQDGIIEAHVDPPKGRHLAELVTIGMIRDVSVTFNAPPAVPILDPDTGHVRWKKDY